MSRAVDAIDAFLALPADEIARRELCCQCLNCRARMPEACLDPGGAGTRALLLRSGMPRRRVVDVEPAHFRRAAPSKPRRRIVG